MPRLRRLNATSCLSPDVPTTFALATALHNRWSAMCAEGLSPAWVRLRVSVVEFFAASNFDFANYPKPLLLCLLLAT